MEEFQILIQAVLDANSIGQADISKIQKIVDKYHLNLTADLEKSNIIAEIKKIVPQLESELQKVTGVDIKINDSDLIKAYNQIEKEAALAVKEQEKLNALQKQSDLDVQSKYYKRIIENNKDIYSLKNKLLKSDTEESAEIQRQINLLEKRNKYNSQQLNKKGLTDDSWERSVNTSKSALENQYKLNAAKQEDITKTKALAQAEKEAAQAAKERASTQSRVTQISKSLNGTGKIDYNVQISQLESQLQKLGLSESEVKQKTDALRQAQQELQTAINNGDNASILAADEKRTEELNKTTNAVKQLKLSYNSLEQPASDTAMAKTLIKVQELLRKNTSVTRETREEWNRYVIELSSGSNVSQGRLNEINLQLQKQYSTMGTLGKLGRSLKDQFVQGISTFSMWLSASTAVMTVISKTREALDDLKEINTVITEISKANDKLSTSELEQIADNSFDVASKYGKTATDYLTGVQEMSRAGYENAESMAELSTAAQGAGDMTADLANQYIVATDKAYKLNGSIKELTAVLDGSNNITNHNAINMTELSEAMTIVGSTAASFGISAAQTTAAVATMSATTQQSGSEVARAFRAILLNIRQVSDEEEGIDAEGLTKYEAACNALNVKLKETKNGVQSLRDPMEVLHELSVEYNKLDESDIKRTNLLNSVGGKLRSTQLDALLRQWDTYEKMLQEYSDGTGSMAREAEKTANSWEGSLNRLSNTWIDTVENLADSKGIITAINTLNGLLSVVNELTGALGSFKSVGAIAGIALGLTNHGIVCKVHTVKSCF